MRGEAEHYFPSLTAYPRRPHCEAHSHTWSPSQSKTLSLLYVIRKVKILFSHDLPKSKREPIKILFCNY